MALLAFEYLRLVLFCLLDPLFMIRCLPPRVEQSIVLILLLSKIFEYVRLLRRDLGGFPDACLQ